VSGAGQVRLQKLGLQKSSAIILTAVGAKFSSVVFLKIVISDRGSFVLDKDRLSRQS
jgi:hypothetical protein